MVISRLRAELRRRLGENGHEADWIIMHVTGMDQSGLVLGGRELTAAELSRIEELAERRMSGEPLQYILGETEFMGLPFKVDKRVLIPRADTETLAETVIEYIGDKRMSVLDIGTGSGCIGISIAKLCPKSEVTLLDLSAPALDVAAANAEQNGVQVRLLRCDILTQTPPGSYDVIVSNPPYIETGVIDGLDGTVKDYEPTAALDGGADGLRFYRRIASAAPGMLKRGGYIAFEIGYDQGRSVTELLKENGFSHTALIRDPCGNDRVVTAGLKQDG